MYKTELIGASLVGRMAHASQRLLIKSLLEKLGVNLPRESADNTDSWWGFMCSVNERLVSWMVCNNCRRHFILLVAANPSSKLNPTTSASLRMSRQLMDMVGFIHTTQILQYILTGKRWLNCDEVWDWNLSGRDKRCVPDLTLLCSVAIYLPQQQSSN